MRITYVVTTVQGTRAFPPRWSHLAPLLCAGRFEQVARARGRRAQRDIPRREGASDQAGTTQRAPEGTRRPAGGRCFHTYRFEDAPALVSANRFTPPPAEERLRAFADSGVSQLPARELSPSSFPRGRRIRPRAATPLLAKKRRNARSDLRRIAGQQADSSPLSARSVGEFMPRLFGCQGGSCVRGKNFRVEPRLTRSYVTSPNGPRRRRRR
jgi:hypothetical protein